MKPEPIDYNNPLGISKREWTKVLGINLALLLLVYAIALICTLCGNDLFLLRFSNERLNAIESFLMERDLLWVIQIPVAGIEEAIICAYSAKKKPNLITFVSYCAIYYAICVAIYFTTRNVPQFVTMMLGIGFAVGYCSIVAIKAKNGKYFLKSIIRLAIASIISYILSGMISIFRNKCFEIWNFHYGASFMVALNLEYDIALAMALGLLTLIIPWEKGGKTLWTSIRHGGSSMTSKKDSPKPTAKNNLNPKLRKRIFLI